MEGREREGRMEGGDGKGRRKWERVVTKKG
jgi:hypothetical protein